MKFLLVYIKKLQNIAKVETSIIDKIASLNGIAINRKKLNISV